MKSLTWPIHFHPDEKMSLKRNKHPPEWPQILRWKSESESVLCFFPPGLKNNTRTTYKRKPMSRPIHILFFSPLDIESQPFSITADVFPTFQRCGPWSVPALWSHTCTRRGAQVPRNPLARVDIVGCFFLKLTNDKQKLYKAMKVMIFKEV